MQTHIEPVFRLVWSEAAGAYEETDERIGFQAVAPNGRVLAYGETEAEAWENAMEATWGSGSADTPPSAVAVAR